MNKTIAVICGNNEKTVYRWKKENRPIISLLEKYFTEEELQEFLENKSIRKLDSKYGMELAILKNYIDYIEDIIAESIERIDEEYHFTELPFYIYFDFLNYINNNFFEGDINFLIDEIGCRQIALKKIQYDYFQNNKELYDPRTFHFLQNMNLITATYILNVTRHSFDEIYQFGHIYDIQIVYFHYIFESFYYKKIDYEELIVLATEKKVKEMKNYLSNQLGRFFF